ESRPGGDDRHAGHNPRDERIAIGGRSVFLLHHPGRFVVVTCDAATTNRFSRSCHTRWDRRVMEAQQLGSFGPHTPAVIHKSAVFPKSTFAPFRYRFEKTGTYSCPSQRYRKT